MFTCLGYKKRSESVSKILKEAKKKKDETTRILVLGTGGSGKSTIIKQIYYSQNRLQMSLEEEEEIRRLLIFNYVSSTRRLLRLAKDLGYTFKRVHRSYVRFLNKQNSLKIDFKQAQVKNAQDLWQDENIQRAYSESKSPQNTTRVDLVNIEYLTKNLRRFVMRAELTLDDVLRARQRTTGIHETEVKIQNRNLALLDVGGQKTERRKWFHIFQDSVDACIFVAALDAFLYPAEDPVYWNAMDESISVWKKLLLSNSFNDNTALIVFLNKKDLLRTPSALTKFALAYKRVFQGTEINYSVAAEFIKEQYVNSETEALAGRKLYTHYTMALDKEDLNFIFESCINNISAQFKDLGM